MSRVQGACAVEKPESWGKKMKQSTRRNKIRGRILTSMRSHGFALKTRALRVLSTALVAQLLFSISPAHAEGYEAEPDAPTSPYGGENPTDLYGGGDLICGGCPSPHDLSFGSEHHNNQPQLAPPPPDPAFVSSLYNGGELICPSCTDDELRAQHSTESVGKLSEAFAFLRSWRRIVGRLISIATASSLFQAVFNVAIDAAANPEPGIVETQLIVDRINQIHPNAVENPHAQSLLQEDGKVNLNRLDDFAFIRDVETLVDDHPFMPDPALREAIEAIEAQHRERIEAREEGNTRARELFGNRQTLPPVVIDLDSDGIELLPAQTGLRFSTPDGYIQFGWVSPDDGILVLDLNHSGTVDRASEIALANLTPIDRDDTDLEALAAFGDTDGNGVYEAGDNAFDVAYVWQDSNGNGISESDELRTLAEVGIAALDLLYSQELSANSYENAIFGLIDVHWDDGSVGLAADVGLSINLDGFAQLQHMDTGHVGVQIGTLPPEPTTFLSSYERWGRFELAHMDGDGVLDVVYIQTRDTGSGKVNVRWLTSASDYQEIGGFYASWFKLSQATLGDFTMADIDGDGLEDLVLLRTKVGLDGKVVLVYTTARTQFGSGGNFITPFLLRDVPSFNFEILKFDSDNEADIVATRYKSIIFTATSSSSYQSYSITQLPIPPSPDRDPHLDEGHNSNL